MHRTETAGSLDDHSPPALPAHFPNQGIQHVEDGSGLLFHRRYVASIRDTDVEPEALISLIKSDPNIVAPTEFARFHKTIGDPKKMSVGDEFLVHMPGPWDGPVRVVDQTPTSYRFVTLRGHLEAGQIEFRARREKHLVFVIESWARSGDRLSGLMFERLRMAKEVQLHMWSSMLERIVMLTGGRTVRGVTIETKRVNFNG